MMIPAFVSHVKVLWMAFRLPRTWFKEHFVPTALNACLANSRVPASGIILTIFWNKLLEKDKNSTGYKPSSCNGPDIQSKA